jgi:hypothetical protein
LPLDLGKIGVSIRQESLDTGIMPGHLELVGVHHGSYLLGRSVQLTSVGVKC